MNIDTRRNDELSGKQDAFWKRALSGAPELLTIQTDHPRPAVLGPEDVVVELAFDDVMAQALAHDGGITLLAAWAGLLARLSRQDDVVVGTRMPMPVRMNSAQARGSAAAGVLALRMDLSGQPSVTELLRRTSERVAEAAQNDGTPADRVVELSGLQRSLSHHPLFQAMFVVEQDGDGRETAAGSPGDVRCDLVLSIRILDGKITGRLSCAAALFGRDSARRIAGHYRQLLIGMLADETADAMRLPLMSDAERRLVIETWNATDLPLPADCGIHELFERQAARHPHIEAVVHGDRRLTYGELNARANGVAHRLRHLGVQPEDRVAICVERGPEMLVGILGVLKAGGGYVPLDPDYPEDRLRFMLTDSASKVLLRRGSVAPAWAAGVAQLDLDVQADDAPAKDPAPAQSRGASRRLAYVIYTSGSTGTPKAVMVEHGNLSNLLADWVSRFEAFRSDRRFQASMWTSFSFDVSVFEMFATLAAGGTLNIVPEAVRADPPALLDWFVRNEISFGYLPPFFVRSLRGLLEKAPRMLPFRQVLVGVEPLHEADLHWLQAATPGLTIVNGYGPTEATVFCTAYQEIAERHRHAPIGRPVAHARIYILDALGQPVPVGVPGELHVGGAGVARGYLHRPELTAARFVSDPFVAEPGARMYRTGDLGRWLPDGNIEFLGRDDFQVKIRGFRIEPGEIEAKLAACPGVAEAAVLAREDAPGDRRLVAYCAGSAPLDVSALRSYLAERLPEYMLPAAFVQLDRLPLTLNGKLDVRALPAPRHEDLVSREFEPPRNDVEAAIAGIWCELLRVDRVGRQDSFLELGGNSLLAIQAISRLRSAMGVDVPFRALIAGSTLVAFADAVTGAAPSLLPAVTRHERNAWEPPSFAQQRLWFLAQVRGAGSAYHVPCGWKASGTLDATVLRRALDRIVERHEALRTTFVMVDGMPMQRVAAWPDAQGVHFIEQEVDSPGEVARLANEEAALPFDLERGPLIRARLIHEGPSLHTILVTMHHVVSDGWSMRVFVQELNALYTAFLAGRDDPLPPPRIQYADYAAWQRNGMSQEWLRAQGEYWAGALAGAPELLSLPLDRPRPPEQDFAGQSIRFALDESTARALNELCLRHGTTRFVALLAGWAALLGRLSGQDDLVIGTPTANRGRAEIEGLIGFFVNTLALRLDVSNDPTVAELLQRVKARALEAQDHQDIPFEQVVELVNPVRSLSCSPLFQVMFAWEDDDGVRLEFPGLGDVAPVRAEQRSAQFDLILTMRETSAGIEGELEFATALFRRETAQRMIGQYRALLAGMVADDAARVADITILSDAERHRLLHEWNVAALPRSNELCIHELFEQQVRKTPDAVAVVYEGQALTYADLNARANRLAHRLRELGAGPDRLVAICAERSLEMVLAPLAVLKAGAAYVPWDPQQPAERRRHLLADRRPVALLVRGDERAADLPEELPRVDLSAAFEHCPDTNPGVAGIGLTPHHLAYVIYTSGSTGTPKGVMVEHRNLVASTLARHASYGDTGRFLLLSPIYFDSSVAGIFGTLAGGGTLVVATQAAIRDPSQLDRVLRRERIDTLLCVPSLYENYLQFSPSGGGDKALGKVIVAGETCPPALLAKSAAREPRVVLFNEYGPTEATVWATMHRCAESPAGGSVPIGRPIPGARIYILDASGNPVPVGMRGQIHIGGAGVARGYLNQPELTGERFVPDPFSAEPRARMYRTGDLGRWLADGSIEFAGRNDFQVKIRGFRIELGEIEAALLDHAAVRQAAVIAREDGAGERQLIAYVVGEAEIDAGQLRRHLGSRLPEYMLPLAYVQMQALPLTPNGKLDAASLPLPLADAYAAGEYEAPANEVEETVASIWMSLLKLQRVGRHDSFFALGGHSLLVMQVVTRVRAALKVEVALNALFAAPVLADFARHVSAAAPSQLPALQKAPRREPLPLSFAQRRLWFIAQMQGGNAAYNILCELRLRGRLDKDALRQALDRIVARHEVLRSTFVPLHGEPVLRIAPAEACRFALTESRVHSDQEVARLAREEEVTPFDLEAGPLIRGRLLGETDEVHTLLISMHHLVSDGWSMGVLAGELAALYDAFARQAPDPLPALAVQYADHALWQQSHLGGPLLEAQATWWKAALAAAPELLALPTDHPRPPEQSYAGGTVPFLLDEALTRSLHALSARHGTTMFMTLLAGWAILLSRFSGQDDIVIGTPVANRGHAETEPLIGLFVNTLALRLDLANEPTVAGLLQQVRTRTLQAQENRDIPFEQVVEHVNPVRSPACNPLFQVMFAWESEGGDVPSFAGLQVEQHRRKDYVVSKFDLTLSARESAHGIDAALEYATALFERATVERVAECYRRLLEGMVAGDELAISRLPLLSGDERRRILETSNATSGPFERNRCVHELFEEQARHAPHALALECGQASLSYAALNRAANKLAHRLRALGAKPDDRVAICVGRGLEMWIGVLGILKAGAAYVPLDPAYPEERLRYIVEDSAPILFVTSGECPDVAGDVPVVDLQALEEGSEENLAPAEIGLSPSHLAYVIYTSGSTGKPKGVMVEHRSACNLVAAQIAHFGAGQGERVLQFASFSFDACVFEMLLALWRGATLVVPASRGLLAGEELARQISTAAVTHAVLTPAVLAALPAGEQLDTLGHLVAAGDVLSEDMARRWAAGRQLVNAYGPTEITVMASLHRCSPDAAGAPPIGRPILNTRIYILDSHREPVPVGVAGELYIGGAGVTRGYLNRPGLTLERFLPDPFCAEPDARMYRTGDLGRWRADGNIDFLGRNDFQVKLRGFRIEPGEIESRLRECPGVEDAVVLVREDVPGDKRLVAYCVGAAGLKVEAMRNQLSERLPHYMVPAAFIRLDAFPLDPNGKLDRKSLPAPGNAAFASRAYEAPQGEFEVVLARIWSELLGVERIGRHDSFFELGGHSLLTIRVISRVRARWELEVPVSAIFAQPTLAGFARCLADAAPARHAPMARANRDEPIPASFAQRRQWFLAQMDGAAFAYHVPFGLRLRGRLDVPALRRALDDILARHESLRTTFFHVDGEPCQRLAPAKDCRFPLVEKVTTDTAESARLANAEIMDRFDLERGPLIRGLLLREDEDVHVLLITMHHIVSDGWSMGILVRELGKLYEVHAQGGQNPLAPLELHYADYAAWQRQSVSGELLGKQGAYWKSSLAGAPELLALPIDHPRPPEQSYAGDTVPLVLDPALTHALKAMALRHGVTPFMTLLAGWAALLSRLSAQDDLVVGTPTANRGRPELEGIIGFFANTLALRLDLSGDPTVATLLQRVKTCSIGAQEHQDIPFEQVVELVNPVRSMAHGPLFQVAFSWESEGALRLELPGVISEPLEDIHYKVAKFDLSLTLRESDGKFEGALEYSTALFEPETVQRMAGYYEALLRGMAGDAERVVGSIPILGEAEHKLLTQTWNDTATPYPADHGLHRFFEEQVARNPGATAVAFHGETIAYAELDRRANRLAHRLRSIGVRPDDRVALCLERGIAMVVGILGILKAGAAYVAMDPAYPEARLRHMLADSAPVALLTSGDPPQAVQQARGHLPVLDPGEAFARQADTDLPGVGLGAGNLAYVIYTSGSTGTPKGVMVEHRGVVNLIADWLRRFAASGNAPAHASLWTSFSFDVSVFELFVPLSAGATVHIVPDDIRGEPTLLLDWFVQHRIALAYLPPFFVRQMDELMANAGAGLPFEHLLVGVEPLLESALYRLQSSGAGRQIRIVNGYGPTETTVFSSSYETMRDIHRNAPIGRPVANTCIYILDSHRQPVPVGVTGELHIGGAGVARGYMNLPELTAQRFVRDPFRDEPGARMYKTGDLARWMPDGNIEFLGRNDHQVKLRGFRVELGEIEARLADHPGIREAVVVAREGEAADKVLVGYYVAPEALPAEALRAHLEERLPRYMVPLAFVRMDALPLLSSGKLDLRALPAPDLAPVRADSDFVAPRDEHETRIAGIWSDVLGIERIGIDDNFFDLGGESFKAFRVIGRIGGGIGVTELFKYPTVRQLAERVSGARGRSQGLLHELTRPIPAGEKTLTLVCIPFPGGGPISYQPLAREMPPGCTVLGLELPGHDYGRRDEKPLPLAEIARRCAGEIARDVTGPIAIYGHCAGGALTIAIARELEDKGIAISRLFIGGHFPTPHLPGKVFAFLRKVLPIHRWASQRSSFDILKSFGFFDEITDVAQQEFVMTNFVCDHQEIEEFYTALYGAPFRKLQTPLTCVVGEMDRATEFYQERYREWEYFCRAVDFAVIPKAGHYFIKHQADELGKIIQEGIGAEPGVPAAAPPALAEPPVEALAAPTAGKTSARSSLATFFTVAVGEIVSMIGSTLTSFALGVWVYQQTALVSTYALMMVFIILPAIALSPVAGTLADRIDRRKLMIASNCLAGFSTMCAASLIWFESLQIWQVYVLAGLTAVANAFRLPAYASMITQIVPKRYYGKANGFVQLGAGMGSLIGPALAGALIGLIGLDGIVLIDLVTFFIALATLLWVRIPDALFSRREEPFFKEMVGGWHYIVRRHSLVAMIVMVTVANYFVGLIESLVTPLVLVAGNPESLGFVMASHGAGILAGSVLMSLWGGTRRRINGILACTLFSGFCIVLAGASPAVGSQASGMFGFGVALALVNAHWISTVQTKVGMELQGRVMATNFMLMEAMVPLGYLSAGPLADRIFEPFMAGGGDWARFLSGIIGTGPGRGIGLVLVLSGAFLVAWSIAAYLYRPIRDLEDILPDARADEVIEADKDKLQEKADLALRAATSARRLVS